MSGPPPPKQKSRTFAQMKADIKAKDEELERLRSLQDEKEKPTPQSIAKKNPNRATPNPFQTPIKLMNFSTDWIEQERSNVIVELQPDLEDEVIKQHSFILANDNLSLLGKSEADKTAIFKTYESYSLLNLVYRLLITLPNSYRLEAKTLLDSIQTGDVPRNTPVIAECFSHIGKTNTSYGNLRIEYPLQLAKKKILKAMINLETVPYFVQEFKLEGETTLPIIREGLEKGVYLDRDAPDFIAARGLDHLNTLSDDVIIWKGTNEDDEEDEFTWVMPSLFEKQFMKNGRYRPDHVFVKHWTNACKPLTRNQDEKATYNKACCAMIAQIIDLHYIEDGKTLAEWSPTFRKTPFAEMKWDDFSTYLGIVSLDAFVSVENLAINFFIIEDYYKNIVERHVTSVFKTVNIKKDEFGSEAQILVCKNWKKDGNNAVDAFLKIEDKNKAVAAGVFNFSKDVKYSVSDRMYLKNSVRSILSTIISNFSRK